MKNRILCLLVLLLGALFAQAEERPDYLSFTALWDYAEIGFDPRPEPYRVDLEVGREENGTITWSDYHYQDEGWGAYGESIWIAPGETVYFRGKKTLEDDEIDPHIGGIGYFWIEETSVDAGGVVTSLIDPTCQRKTLPPMCFMDYFRVVRICVVPPLCRQRNFRMGVILKCFMTVLGLKKDQI